MSSNHKIEMLKELLVELTDDKQSIPARYSIHKTAVNDWKTEMAQGTLTGRAFSTDTVANYARYVDDLLKNHDELSIDSFRVELQATPAHMFGRRDKYYKAIVCFAKFLIRYHSLPESFLEQAKEIKPKRHRPPKQSVINEKQLTTLLDSAHNSYQRLIINFLVATGLRASELCSLNIEDLDLEQGIVTVQCGKGGKKRRVGISNELSTELVGYLASRGNVSPASHFWIDKNGNRMTRDGLLNRFRRIGQKAGVHLSPHMLRRAFVTLNANKGRSLVMLQMACGHADIKTTRSYCKTTEDEMIQAMRAWS